MRRPWDLFYGTTRMPTKQAKPLLERISKGRSDCMSLALQFEFLNPSSQITAVLTVSVEKWLDSKNSGCPPSEISRPAFIDAPAAHLIVRLDLGGHNGERD